MAATSTDIDINDDVDTSSPFQMFRMLQSFNYVVLMGDSYSGKSLLMAKTIEPDLIPDGNYTPTNGFAKCVVDTPLGDVHVVEISGQIDTWIMDLSIMLQGASLVIILKQNDKPEINWRDLVKATNANMPFIEVDNMSLETFRGILIGVALKMYPYRNMLDPAIPTKQTAIEIILLRLEKEKHKIMMAKEGEIEQMAKFMEGTFEIIDSTESEYLKEIHGDKQELDTGILEKIQDKLNL